MTASAVTLLQVRPARDNIAGMATPGALVAQITPDELVARVAEGAVPNQLAREFGVTRQSVHCLLRAHPDYPAARLCGMHSRLDEVEIAMREGAESDIPRMRELWRIVSWRAEREHPSTWGSRPDAGQAQVTINIVRSGGEQVEVSVNAAPAQLSGPKK